MKGKCILCGERFDADPILKLPNMPSCAQNLPDRESVKDDVGVDLNLYSCRYCGLVQLDCDPVHYYRDVIRAGGGTTTMRELRDYQYKKFIGMCNLAGKKILEVGCGQGEFLEMLSGHPVRGVGIENKQELVDIAKNKGLNVFRDFAGDRNHVISGGPYDAFMQFNFIEHQPDPNGMVQCVYNNLVDGGVGLVTAPSWEYVRNDCTYEIMRDHIAYYDKESLSFLFRKNGFEVLDAEIVIRDTLSLIVKKRPLVTSNDFRANFSAISQQMNNFVEEHTTNRCRLAFWAASHQCFTAAALLTHPEKVNYIVDCAKFKQGRYSPLSHIPIVAPEKLTEEPVNAILILAPGYTNEIAKVIRDRFGNEMTLYAMRTESIEKL